MRAHFGVSALVVLLASCGAATAQKNEARTGDLVVTGTDKRVEIRVAGKLVGVYEAGPEVAKPYLWPLLTPTGEHITRDWPLDKNGPPGGTTDHVHQKSAWFCHGDVIPEGLPLKDKIKGVVGVDFWSEARGHGKIVCTRGPTVGVISRSGDGLAGPCGEIDSDNEWQTADGTKILDEKRKIRFYPLADAYLYVFDIDLSAPDYPITFGDTKEGAFGIRINDVLREQKGNGKLENAGGKVGERNIWGMRSPWCDYSGKIGDREVGLAVFDDPSNKFPACWHSRGYGLMAANPFGRAKSGFPAEKGNKDLVKLAKGEHLHLRYGILIHAGDAKTGKVAERFDQFVKLK